jgi:hypothetical protein
MEREDPNISHYPPEAGQPTTRAVVEFLSNEFHFPAIDLYIERQFERRGWLATLEQAGILPVVVSPNPFDPKQDEAAHTQWWQQHPSELEAFEEKQEARQAILKVLHIGALIGHLDGARLYPGRNLPQSGTK